MAIKIIKQGVKEFHITCPYCGCEFTYENEDVCNSEVICPCCSTNLPHKGVIGTVNDKPFIGKFASVDALYRAYERLEAEFTRRSQRLKALEAGTQRNTDETTPQGVSPDSCDSGKAAGETSGGNGDLDTETIPQLQRIYYGSKTGAEYNDLVYRPFTLPDWAMKSDNLSGCEGCPNNPKYLKTPYIGDSPCQWCQKSPWKITCTSNRGQGK